METRLTSHGHSTNLFLVKDMQWQKIWKRGKTFHFLVQRFRITWKVLAVLCWIFLFSYLNKKLVQQYFGLKMICAPQCDCQFELKSYYGARRHVPSNCAASKGIIDPAFNAVLCQNSNSVPFALFRYPITVFVFDVL